MYVVVGGGEVTQWFRVSSALDDLSSVPHTLIRELATACNSRSGDSYSRLLLTSMVQTHIYTIKHKIKILEKDNHLKKY